MDYFFIKYGSNRLSDVSGMIAFFFNTTLTARTEGRYDQESWKTRKLTSVNASKNPVFRIEKEHDAYGM